MDLAFCLERIAEGQAMTELYELPELFGARTDRAFDRAAAVFGTLTDSIVRLDPAEAELAKLITNKLVLPEFAAANQFYMIANDQGLDYERIRSALITDYPRAQDLPRAGFAAARCLFKDTMQLAAFNDNKYFLGHSAMLINEGLPLYVRPAGRRALRPLDDDRRHSGHVVQGGERRRAREAVLQIAPHPALPRGRRHLNRSQCERRSDPAPVGRGPGRGRPADRRRAASRIPADRGRQADRRRVGVLGGGVRI